MYDGAYSFWINVTDGMVEDIEYNSMLSGVGKLNDRQKRLPFLSCNHFVVTVKYCWDILWFLFFAGIAKDQKVRYRAENFAIYA